MIQEVEFVKSTANEAIELSEKLTKELFDATEFYVKTEQDEQLAEEIFNQAEEQEADALINEEQANFDITEAEDNIQSTDNAAKKAEYQENLENA